jgi:hypothetical protein
LKNQLSRLIARELPEHEESEVELILAAFGQESWHQEILRVKCACLKLSEGNIDRLREIVKVACVDYRDVLAWAEYPRQMRIPAGRPIGDAVAKDMKQLQDWLKK